MGEQFRLGIGIRFRIRFGLRLGFRIRFGLGLGVRFGIRFRHGIRLWFWLGLGFRFRLRLGFWFRFSRRIKPDSDDRTIIRSGLSVCSVCCAFDSACDYLCTGGNNSAIDILCTGHDNSTGQNSDADGTNRG